MKKWIFVALLVVGATILGATVLREPIASAAQTVDANIIGPLDGQGDIRVHEQGTAAVNAQQAGGWSVGISGTPSVKLDPAGNTVQVASSGQPLAVRDVNEPAFQPFHKRVIAVAPPGTGKCESFTTPVGVRLALQYVSALVNSDPGDHVLVFIEIRLVFIEIRQFHDGDPVPDTGQDYEIPVVDEGHVFGSERFVASEAVHVYRVRPKPILTERRSRSPHALTQPAITRRSSWTSLEAWSTSRK